MYLRKSRVGGSIFIPRGYLRPWKGKEGVGLLRDRSDRPVMILEFLSHATQDKTEDKSLIQI